MREIKFRVWNTLLKKYIPDDLVHISSDGSFLFGFFSYIKVDFYKYRDDIFRGENIAEQFTGLRDINGREIYEGDILIDDTGEPIEYWVVKFSDGGFIGECAGTAEPLFELANLEIVGNIHENSELVEER